jgi:hypothetical protein
MILYRSNISRVFHPHNFMISPSETPTFRKSRAAVRLDRARAARGCQLRCTLRTELRSIMARRQSAVRIHLRKRKRNLRNLVSAGSQAEKTAAFPCSSVFLPFYPCLILEPCGCYVSLRMVALRQSP